MNRAFKIIVTLFILFIITLGGAVYFFVQYRKVQTLNNSNSLSTEEEVMNVVGLVSKHVVLPKDEIPSIAIVDNVEELKNLAFFENAKNGFKVLVYRQSGLAVMYDPESDLVVNMAKIEKESFIEEEGVQELHEEDKMLE